MSKKLINGLKYEKLTEDQLYDLSQWELVDIILAYREDLKAKEQECEELKEEIKKHNDDMFKNPPEKRFYCKGCTLPYISKKLRQTLTEIKEIAEKLKSFYEELGKCEDLTVVRLKQILQKISEVEDV